MKSSNKTCSIYAIQCIKNHRIFVGAAQDVTCSTYLHFRALRNGEKLRRAPEGHMEETTWQKDFNRYGPEGFCIFEIESGVPAEARKERVSHYISKYRSDEMAFGYNARNPRTKTSNEILHQEPIPAFELSHDGE